ncbi:hypothetical protein Rleg9DRAFT_2576 [Rhizobium leguminosarum bv. trifolii WSM597]|uniref:Uncharacterized protein n=1 Tax=Rhizobium leguminosarum bv. trifolii WSM597 TaxID=754764 RepID=I9N744_RHILT|nr:hypothetical protein Rleg9DRAFT_2576 [Rhizobium leguminosarum bv. trifolii WSM597]
MALATVAVQAVTCFTLRYGDDSKIERTAERRGEMILFSGLCGRSCCSGRAAYGDYPAKPAESPAPPGFFVGAVRRFRFSSARKDTSLTIEAERSNFRLFLRPACGSKGSSAAPIWAELPANTDVVADGPRSRSRLLYQLLPLQSLRGPLPHLSWRKCFCDRPSQPEARADKSDQYRSWRDSMRM